MEWVRTHSDRVLLIVAALNLFFWAIWIWRHAAGFGERFPIAPALSALKSPSWPDKAGELNAAEEKLRQPPRWVFGGRSGLFVPEKHFIGPNGLPATLQTTILHPPVPNEWLEQFGLPIQDVDVLEQDSDGDGFTNLDEWLGHTDPVDRNSHAGYLTKLKLKSFSHEPFPLVFSSWVDNTFAINAIDLSRPTQFLKVGDMISGTRFKIVKFDEKYQPNQYGTDIDISELTLQHRETGEQLKLVKEQVAISPESVAAFVYTWGGRQEFEVRKDQEFSLKPQDQIKYKLIDVQPTKAVIVNPLQKPNERIEIGLLAP